MYKLGGEKVLMRIHMSESDKYDGRLAYQAIVSLLRERHMAGATVLRGSMSFGAHAELHTDRIEVLSYDMPIAVECVDSEENIRAILPQLDAMIGGGMITLERADVIVYRAGEEEGNPGLH